MNSSSGEFNLNAKIALSTPASDGDMRCKLFISITNDSDRAVEYLDIQGVIRNRDNAAIQTIDEQMETFIGTGATETVVVWVYYVNQAMIGSIDEITADLHIALCSSDYGELPTTHLTSNAKQISGTQDSINLSDGFLVEGMTCWFDEPDSDGDCQVHTIICLHNSMETEVVMCKGLVSILDHRGRELEKSESENPFGIGMRKALESNIWNVKAGHIASNSSVKTAVAIFPLLKRVNVKSANAVLDKEI